MVEIVKVSEAKARLSELIAKAEKGEEVLIARGAKPVARLVTLNTPVNTRKPGRLAHWGAADDRALFEPEPGPTDADQQPI